MFKVAPSARLREEIAAFLAEMEAKDGSEALSRLALLGFARLVQDGLEQGQADSIGRERYERGERRGHRNDYVRGHLEVAEGRVAVAVPQVRDAQGTYRSKLYDFLRGHSHVVERLAIEMYARGLSTRHVEAAFTDADGVCLLSRTAVSEVTEALWAEYEAFQGRWLAGVSILGLFLDGL